MKITTPYKMQSGKEKVEELISKFEKEFLKKGKDLNYYHLVVEGEYKEHIRKRVEYSYLNAGWAKVQCRTSSENNEKPGLTGLHLWRVS